MSFCPAHLVGTVLEWRGAFHRCSKKRHGFLERESGGSRAAGPAAGENRRRRARFPEHGRPPGWARRGRLVVGRGGGDSGALFGQRATGPVRRPVCLFVSLSLVS